MFQPSLLFGNKKAPLKRVPEVKQLPLNSRGTFSAKHLDMVPPSGKPEKWHLSFGRCQPLTDRVFKPWRCYVQQQTHHTKKQNYVQIKEKLINYKNNHQFLMMNSKS